MNRLAAFTPFAFFFCLAGSASAREPRRCPAAPEVSVRVTGSPIHGANGIAFDGDDRLHVASVFGREIVVLDRETGAILDRYTSAQGVETPDDLAFGPDGSLYLTAIGTGEIMRRTAAGVVETIAALPPGVNPIALSPDGRLLVGSCFLGTGLFEVDPEGVEAPRLIRDFPGEPCGVNAFDVGVDGRLYAPRFFDSQVVSIDVDTGETVTVDDDFSVPVASKFGPDGGLYVIDTDRGELVKLDLASGTRTRVADVPRNSDNLAFDSDGRLFISHAADGSVGELMADGSLREISPGGLALPGGIAVTHGRFFVADHGGLVEFDAASGDHLSTETSIVGISELAEPFTVAAAGRNLVLSSWLSNTVQVWDPRRKAIVQSVDDFAIPLNAIAFRRGLAVAELGTGSVVLERNGTRETLVDGLIVPTGMAARGSTLYVADWATGTVSAVRRDGAVVVASGLSGPEGLAFDRRGRLLVVESLAGRVSAVDVRSGESTTLADGLALGLPGIPGFPPTYVFNGIDVDSRGTAYVTGDVDNVVYALSTRPGRQHGCAGDRRH